MTISTNNNSTNAVLELGLGGRELNTHFLDNLPIC